MKNKLFDQMKQIKKAVSYESNKRIRDQQPNEEPQEETVEELKAKLSELTVEYNNKKQQLQEHIRELQDILESNDLVLVEFEEAVKKQKEANDHLSRTLQQKDKEIKELFNCLMKCKTSLKFYGEKKHIKEGMLGAKVEEDGGIARGILKEVFGE